MKCQRCNNQKNKFSLYDAAGIFLTYVCEDCEDEVRERYRSVIFTDFDYDCDEPKEEAY